MDGTTARNAHGETDDTRDDDTGGGGARESKLTAKVLDTVIPAQVEDRHAARRRILHWLGIVLSFGIAALALYVLTRTFMQIDFEDLREAVAATSAERFVLAFLLTSVSFLALTGYDGLALRQLKLRVPYRITALASFTSYAVSFTLGFPLITAATVRYWIYSTRGLSAGKVASLTVIAGLTFWLGMVLVIGLGLAVRAEGVAHLDHLSPWLNRTLGIAILGAMATYLVYAAKGRRVEFLQFKLELPGFWLSLGQICLGLIDLCAAAGVLYVLLAPPRLIDYITFVALYVLGSLLGIASNAPGGIGVFEATMLKTVPSHTEAELFAALLLFRVIYYLVPFVLALAMIGAHEAIRRWKSLRAAMMGDDDDDPNGDTVD